MKCVYGPLRAYAQRGEGGPAASARGEGCEPSSQVYGPSTSGGSRVSDVHKAITTLSRAPPLLGEGLGRGNVRALPGEP